MKPNVTWVISVLFLPASVSATTWHVPAQCPTIQAGIDSASAGDTVMVACGMYYEHDIVMKSGVCLRSEAGLADCVTIDCEDQGRGIYCEGVDSTATLLGFTVTGGTGDPGGGVYCQDSSPAISHCSFSGNRSFGPAGCGGGVVCLGTCRPTISDCVFSGNSAESGGALYIHNSSRTTLADCIFSGNNAGDPVGSSGGAVSCAFSNVSFLRCTFADNWNWLGSGGALFCNEGSVQIVGCAFARNGCGGTWWGGALDVSNCTVTVTECSFVENTATQGAAINCEGSTATITGCLLSRNVVVGEEWDPCGGALYCGSSSSLTVTGCTFSHNSAPYGSGICCTGDGSLLLEESIVAFGLRAEAVSCFIGNPILGLTCCDIYGNEGGDWTGCIADEYGVNGNISMDPLFCDPDNDDFQIDAASPCAPGNHPDGYPCGLIGAFDVGCDTSSAERETWGRVKAMYREHEVE